MHQVSSQPMSGGSLNGRISLLADLALQESRKPVSPSHKQEEGSSENQEEIKVLPKIQSLAPPRSKHRRHHSHLPSHIEYESGRLVSSAPSDRSPQYPPYSYWHETPFAAYSQPAPQDPSGRNIREPDLIRFPDQSGLHHPSSFHSHGEGVDGFPFQYNMNSDPSQSFRNHPLAREDHSRGTSPTSRPTSHPLSGLTLDKTYSSHNPGDFAAAARNVLRPPSAGQMANLAALGQAAPPTPYSPILDAQKPSTGFVSLSQGHLHSHNMSIIHPPGLNGAHHPPLEFHSARHLEDGAFPQWPAGTRQAHGYAQDGKVWFDNNLGSIPAYPKQYDVPRLRDHYQRLGSAPRSGGYREHLGPRRLPPLQVLINPDRHSRHDILQPEQAASPASYPPSGDMDIESARTYLKRMSTRMSKKEEPSPTSSLSYAPPPFRPYVPAEVGSPIQSDPTQEVSLSARLYQQDVGQESMMWDTQKGASEPPVDYSPQPINHSTRHNGKNGDAKTTRIRLNMSKRPREDSGRETKKWPRREGEKRRVQNALAQKRFRGKKKMMNQQMIDDLERAKAELAARDQLIEEMSRENMSLKRKTREVAHSDGDEAGSKDDKQLNERGEGGRAAEGRRAKRSRGDVDMQ